MATVVNQAPPPYVTGTVAGDVGQAVVTGAGTLWMLTDANGNAVAAVFPGDDLVAPTTSYRIKSVDSATQLTLETPLLARITVGTPCRISRNVPSPNASLIGTLQAVLAQGTDTAPDVSRTIDTGAVRMKFRQGAAGHAEIAVGPTGTPDAALVPVLQFSPTGTLSLPSAPPTGRVGRAARAAFFVLMGASMSAFVATIGDPDNANDGFYSFYIEPYAPPNGVLWGLMSSYLQSSPGPALSPSAALAQLNSIWTAAQAITP